MLFLFASDLGKPSELADLKLPTAAVLQEEIHDQKDMIDSLKEHVQTLKEDNEAMKKIVREVYTRMNEASEAFLKHLGDLLEKGDIKEFTRAFDDMRKHTKETLVDPLDQP